MVGVIEVFKILHNYAICNLFAEDSSHLILLSHNATDDICKNKKGARLLKTYFMD